LTIAAVIVAIVELPLCLFGLNAARRNPPRRIRFQERLDRM
jgi:hypothetical protein